MPPDNNSDNNGSNLKVLSMKCTMCANGEVGLTWTKNLLWGHSSYDDAATFFNMSVDQVIDHCSTHVVDVDESGDITSGDFNVDHLLNILSNLKLLVSKITVEKGETTSGIINSVTRCTKEIRETVKTLSDFQSRSINAGNADRLTNMENNVNGILNVIMVEICPDCKEKVLAAISEK